MHLSRSRMRNLQGETVKGRELAEIIWQALEAVKGEIQRTQPRQGAHLLVNLCDLVVRSICAIARSQARGSGMKSCGRAGGCGSSSITKERQAFEVSELSRERHELVVGDVQRGDLPVLQDGPRHVRACQARADVEASADCWRSQCPGSLGRLWTCWKRGNGSWARPRQERETTVDGVGCSTTRPSSRARAAPMLGAK